MKQAHALQYRDLMALRLKIFFYVPLALLIFAAFLINMGVHIVIVTAMVAGCLYFSMFYFLSKNICPWCSGCFFSFGGLHDKKLANVIFAKKCQHCGKPNAEDL